MVSLQTKHFLTSGAHVQQHTTWQHGWNNISRFKSEQTKHSSKGAYELPCVLCAFVSNSSLSLSFWHLSKVLQRLGSGHRSRGVCPFLFLIVKSAPFAAKKQAMLADDFLSAPWLPRPIRSLPTSCTSCSWRSCDRVWWRRASCRGVSPSLSAMFRFAPSPTSNCNNNNYYYFLIILR